MEHQINAPADGVVADVLVGPGEQVDTGQVLLQLEARVTGERPIRIANCSGFYGDRLSAAQEMVDGGPIDVLTGDWLAELTMLILWKAKARNADAGYATTFLTQMEQVLGTCIERGIKVVSNAGGLNPAGCAERVRDIAADSASRCASPTSRATTSSIASTGCGRTSPTSTPARRSRPTR